MSASQHFGWYQIKYSLLTEPCECEQLARAVLQDIPWPGCKHTTI